MYTKKSFLTILFRLIPTMVCISLFLSCSQSNPEIKSCMVQLLRVQGPTGAFAERLSVFVYFDDADGPSDFSSISVAHDATGLAWNILPDNAMVRLRGNDRWTGSNSLAAPGDGNLPTGNYTVTVSDLAGNESVKTFTLVHTDFPEYAPVQFNVNGDSWSLARNSANSFFSRTYLLMYNAQTQLVYSWLLSNDNEPTVTGTIETLRSYARDVASVQCYTENADGSAGVLLIPVNIE